MTKKILIVEDDLDIAEDLQDVLEYHGYSAEIESNGLAVKDKVMQFQPDLILLDLMLPGQDGEACCKQVREFTNVPIIMLTAKVEQADKLSGLSLGADDYVCKPFDMAELMLRIDAVIRRTQGQIQFSQFNINDERKEVSYLGQVVPLSALEYALFALLYNSPERVFSRDQIIDLAYPGFRDITDRAIDSHVKNIRKKFKAHGIASAAISAVYGMGYRFSTATKNK